MQSAAQTRGWLGPAILGVAALTVYRVVLLGFDRTDLFVDEAQYWLWGQSLEFGYYSKPPLIGWVIRAVTEVAGSDDPFWIRLPGALCHAATALILGALAARLAGARAGLLTALCYATLPIVAVGSFLISTDTIMFPFLALALLFWHRATEGAGWAAPLAGIALGLALMGKYAAFYYIMGAGLSAAFFPAARVRWGQAGLALLAMLVVISPNILWNLGNGFATVEHTLDNADWVRDPGTRAALNPAGLAEFVAAQFAVFGPVLLGVLIWLAIRWPQGSGRWLVYCLPVLALVCGQALVSKAYANWAATAYLAGLIAVVPWLMTRRWLLVASLVINGALALLIPLLPTQGDRVLLRGQPILERYLGRVEMSQMLLTLAKAQETDIIVADHRDLLADLFHAGREAQMVFRAAPYTGRPSHHYEQRYPFAGSTTPVIYASREPNNPPPCPAELLVRIAPEAGAYRRHPVTVWLVPGNCWDQS